MLSVDDKCAIRGWRHGGRRKSTEKRCFFYLPICEHDSEVKYMARVLTPPKKTGVKKTAAKAAIGNAVVKAAKIGAREGAAEVAASRIARQTGASMAKSTLGGSAFARQTGSSMVGGMKPKKTINTLKKRPKGTPGGRSTNKLY